MNARLNETDERRTAARQHRGLRAIALPKTAVLIVVLGPILGQYILGQSIANGASIPVFVDNFNANPPGTNPGTPLVGLPWQISEVADDSIMVDDQHRLMFGQYRNTAVAPFSTDGRALIRQYRNLSVSFDYLGLPGEGTFSQYLDVGAFDPASGDPAFFLRFSHQSDPGSGGLHSVLYLDPTDGLIDTGLDIRVHEALLNDISIVADFANQTYQVSVQDNTTEPLPMFIGPDGVGPDEVGGVQFANYGMAAGSGSIDNLEATVNELGRGSSVPEMASIWMGLAGLLALIGVWAARRTGKR